uniref:Flagellar FliJ protein n=1 Tax=Desulfurella acetivorans TaxID=33002 RepID=A0A832ERK6_DESAE
MFVFKFEKIKNIKENIINIEIIKLSEINNQIKQKTLRISELKDQIKIFYKRFDDQIKTQVDFSILKYLSEEILACELEIQSTQKTIEELEAKKKAQIEIIKNLHKEIKKFEKLKEHYKERYIYDEKLKSQNFINDISTIFYNRNS